MSVGSRVQPTLANAWHSQPSNVSFAHGVRWRGAFCTAQAFSLSQHGLDCPYHSFYPPYHQVREYREDCKYGKLAAMALPKKVPLRLSIA